MKKSFVFALAALTLVASVKGVQVEWTSGELDVSSIAPITSVTAYYFVVTGNTALENAFLGNYDTSTLLETSDKDWTLKDGTAASAATFTAGPDNSAPFEVSTTRDVTADEYVVVVYEATSAFGGKYVIANMGYVALDATNELEPGIDSEKSVTFGLGSDALAYEGGWTAVPEPTTVALLALGLAAVGLKRKVA